MIDSKTARIYRKVLSPKQYAYRVSRWERGRVVRGKGIWDCSVPWCRSINIRETEDGVFCEYHYFNLPTCSERGCLNVSMGEVLDVKAGPQCRDCHFKYEPSSIQVLSKSFSMFSVPKEMM